AAPALPTKIFYDYNMRQHGDWIERVVASLGENVYVTIDCDGFDPAIMPAVGTPEPGGLTWYEALALLRRVIESRRLVGCDIVELCPLRVRFLARVAVGEAELHQDTVVGQRPVLALGELLERVDRLIVLAASRLGFGQSQPGHLSVDAIARAIDHLLIGRGRLRGIAE